MAAYLILDLENATLTSNLQALLGDDGKRYGIKSQGLPNFGSFDSDHDYTTDGVAGTAWDQIEGSFGLLNQNITIPGQLKAIVTAGDSAWTNALSVNVSGDFSFVAKSVSDQGSDSTYHINIGFWIDANNSINIGKSSGNYIAYYRKDIGVVSSIRSIAGPGPFSFRIKRESGVVGAYYTSINSPEEDDWILWATLANAGDGKVGISNHTSGTQVIRFAVEEIEMQSGYVADYITYPWVTALSGATLLAGGYAMDIPDLGGTLLFSVDTGSGFGSDVDETTFFGTTLPAIDPSSTWRARVKLTPSGSFGYASVGNIIIPIEVEEVKGGGSIPLLVKGSTIKL